MLFRFFLDPLLLLLLFILLLIILYLLWARSQGRFPFPPPRYPRREFYVKDQLILAGPEETINWIVNEQPQGVRLRELEPPLAFDELGEQLRNCPDFPNGIIIGKYQIQGLLPDVARTIDRIDKALGGEASLVRRDPNWLTGHPYEVEGSPYEVEGSPYEVEGSGGGTVQFASPDLFLSQWGFETIGLVQNGDKRTITGRGVRVGIFDTSPFVGVSEGAETVKELSLQKAPSPLRIKVFHPKLMALEPSSLERAGRQVDVRNHGYFVAGLVHAIAPDSEIQLIRVLENDNRGDLYTLMKAVFEFLKRNSKEERPKTGAVVNLSLGIRVAPGEAKFGLPTEVLSLQYLMDAAHCLGTVVVAAAGNNSSRSSLPLSPNHPASLSGVIGVAASNNSNRRSCFSNGGKVAAPGGDGRSKDTENGDRNCKPRGQDCSELENCTSAVVGPFIKPPYTDEKENGYVFWSGSSFSAPMVTGLAALVLQAGQGNLSPTLVARLIACGATLSEDQYLGAGIIHIGNTLELCARRSKGEAYQREPLL